jgi:hypothetical protein
METKTKFALSVIPLANNALMKEVLEINLDARFAQTTASTFTLQLRNALVLAKMVIMSPQNTLALHALNPAINAMELQLPAQIASKIVNFLSFILKLV